jgi:hypothetical protein
MMECLDDAKEELKRVDHLIYVSLKYTRTVDVLLNTLGRMIDYYDFIMESLLKYAEEKRMIMDIPLSPRERADLIKETFEDEIIKENINLYLLMRKLHKSNPQKEQEFRRHVAMISIIDNREEIVNIDVITEYYHMEREFWEYVKNIIESDMEST